MINKGVINIPSSLFLFILLIMPIAAIAHTPLASSIPANGEKLDISPTEIIMVFKFPTKLTRVDLKKSPQTKSRSLLKRLFGSDKSEPILLGKNSLLKTGTRHVIPLPSLKRASYELVWRAIGKDGHVIKGKLSFAITCS